MASRDDKVISEEAAAWWSRRGAGGAADRTAFAAWLAEDLRHGAAFDAIAAAWDALGELSEDQPADGESEANLVRVLDEARRARQSRNRILRRGLIGGGIAASLGGFLLWTTMSTKTAPAVEFSTGAGQRIRRTLADGSVLDLDANSSVRVALGSGRRDVHLVRGRVLFDVAKDARRPFVVRTNNGTVTVLGTLFTVEYRDAETSVTLFRGRVRAAGAESSAAFDLTPGDALRIGEGGDARLSHHVDLAKALLWRDGHLVFENETLGHVVARMNDYGRDPIVISDPAVAGLRISGIFQAGHNEAFLKALTSYYGLAVTRRDHSVVIASANARS